MNALSARRPVRLALLFCLLGVLGARADDADALLGLWRTPGNNLVAVQRDPAGALQGRLNRVGYASERVGFREGQVVLQSFQVTGPAIGFDSAVQIERPELAAQHAPTFTRFTGTLAPDGSAIAGSRPEGRYVLQTDENGTVTGFTREELDTREAQSYTRVPTRLTLSDLRTGGWFLDTRSKFEPPILPCAAVTRDGTFRLFLPIAAVLGNTVSLFLEDISGTSPLSGHPVASQLGLTLAPAPNGRWAEVVLEEKFPEFFHLQAGPYIVRVIVRAPNSTRVAWSFTTPPFSKQSITAALLQRLDDMAQDLFGMPFMRWKEMEQADADRAKRELWRGLYLRGRTIAAAVDVTSHAAPEAKFDVTLEIAAIFERAGAQVLGSQALYCSEYRLDRPPALGVGANETRRIDVGALALGAQMRSALTNDKLLRMRARLTPPFGRPAEFEIFTNVELPPEGSPARQALVAKRGLATAMHLFGAAQLDSLPAEPGPYETILRMIKNSPANELNYDLVHQEGVAAVAQDWEHFRELKALLEARTGATGEAALDRLDLEVRKNAGKTLAWGVEPFPERSISANGAAPGNWNDCCPSFVLPTPKALMHIAVAGAYVNAEGPSFAFDPDLWVPRGGETEPEAESKPPTIPGITDWLWENTPNGLADDLRRDPNLARLLERLLDPQTGRLSPNVSRKLLNDRSPDSVRGAIHEEAGVHRVLGEELARMRAAEPGARLVLVSGDYVRGADLQGNAGKLLTDGIILEVRPDGTFRLRRIMEAKAGGPGASKVGLQFAKDAVRISRAGLQLKNLPAELQQQLGVSAANVDIPFSPQLADFTAPEMYVSVVPNDVRVAPEIGYDAEIRYLNERIQKLAQERDAATEASQQRRLQSQIDRLNRQVESATRYDREFLGLVGGEATRERMKSGVAANARQTDYSTLGLSTVAENAYGAHGAMELRWNAGELTFHQFKATTAANLPPDLPMGAYTEAELLNHWSNGDRFNPATGDWSFGELATWQRPAATQQELYDSWRSSVSKRTGENPERQEAARERIRQGQRYDPERGWVSPNSPNSKSGIYSINPADPLLPDAEFVTWWQANRADGLTAEQIVQRRRGKLYDPASGEFREPTDRPGLGRLSEKQTVRLREEFGGRYAEMLESKYHERAAVAENLTWAAVEGMQRITAALNEYGKLRNQELHVSLLCRGNEMRIWVRIQTLREGEPFEYTLPADAQKALLRSWYRNAYYVASDSDVPEWLR